MKKIILATAILASAVSLNANATLIGATSASGLNLNNGQTESNAIVGYNELQDVTIGANSVYADYLAGANMFVGNSYAGVTNSTSGLVLDAGIYDSHILHFDPVGNNGGTATNANGNTSSASFSFDGDIVAVILGTQYLNAGDSVFGNASNYNNHIDRRFETHDLFSFSATDILTVNLAKVGSGWIDNIRVVTSATSVAEPSSIALLGLGLAAFAGLRRKQK